MAIGFGSRKETYVDQTGTPKSLFEKARKFLHELPVEFRGGWDEDTDAPHMRIKFPETGSIINAQGQRAAIAAYFASVTTFSPSITTRILWLNIGAALDYRSLSGPRQLPTQGRNHRTQVGPSPWLNATEV